MTRFPIPCRYRAWLACAALLLFLMIGFPASSQTRPKSPAKSVPPAKKVPPKAATKASDPLADLQHRSEALKQAIAGGNPEQVVAASQKLAALAEVRVANLKMLVGAYGQALELYRKSLALEDTPETRISVALAALRAGKIDEAFGETSSVLQANPKDPRAWHLQAKYWMAKGEFASAVDSLKKSLALKDDPNVRYSLAGALMGAGKKPEADAVFQEMLRDYGDRAIWHVVFGGAYQQTGDLEDAIREFRRAAAMDTRVSHVHLYLGLALLEQNHWARTEESTAEMREALRQDPNNFIANVVLGVGESQLKQFALSNEHLKKATTMQPDALEPWLYLGLNAFQENQYAIAKPYLLKAIELSRDDPSQGNYEIRRAYIALSRIEFAAGNKADTDRYVARAKELQEKAHSSTAESLAENMGGMGGAAIAIPRQKAPEENKMGEALHLDPTAPVDQSALANVTVEPSQQAQLKEVEKRLRAVLSQCYNDWGTAEARQQLYALALEHFQEAERWDNSTPGLARNIGLAALRLGDPKEAARALRLAVEQDPHDQTSQARLAMLYFQTDDFADAAKQFDALGEASYRDPSLTYAWAYSLAQIKESKRATEVLNHVAAFDLSPETLLSVGDLYGVLQDYEHAVSTYRKALQLNPNLPKAHYKAGAALIRLSRPADAVPELQAELKLSPEDVDVQYNLAYALLRMSEKQKAMEILKAIVSAHPDHPGAQYELGKTLLDDGNLDGGVQHLEIAAKLDPGRDYIHYQLQTAYRRLGRKEDADREAAIYRELKARQREEATIPQASKPE